MRKQLLFGVLAVVLLFGVVAFASADVVTYDDTATPGEATNGGALEVKASVNPKITLTVDAPDGGAGQTWVDFGAVDPGVHNGKAVGLLVSSNKAFDLTSSQDTAAFGSGGTGQITLTRDLEDSVANAKGKDIPFTDNYEIDVPWDTDPGSYSAFVTYTVTQN